jgi:hypothetical protein
MRFSASRGAGRPPAAVLALAAGLMVLAWACKSPIAPSGGEADITITSNWDSPVNVYMDGVFKFPLNYKETAEIDDVSFQDHLLEAKDLATGEPVASTTIEVKGAEKYTWTIEHRARINCDNGTNEALRIFLDGVFQFDLADRENRWIINVTLGSHFLKALRAGDGKEIAAITLDVSENKDYAWGIQIVSGAAAVPLSAEWRDP